MNSGSGNSGVSSIRDKKPVVCQDDPFGFNAEVVYGDFSYPLRRCVPFTPATNSGQIFNERAAAEAVDASGLSHPMQEMSNTYDRGQPNSPTHTVWPENSAVDSNSNCVTFTDGGSPVEMAVGGMRSYKFPQMDSLMLLKEEGWDKRPSPKKRGGGRGGKKSRRKHQK